jgi:hypothetical protein
MGARVAVPSSTDSAYVERYQQFDDAVATISRSYLRRSGRWTPCTWSPATSRMPCLNALELCVQALPPGEATPGNLSRVSYRTPASVAAFRALVTKDPWRPGVRNGIGDREVGQAPVLTAMTVLCDDPLKPPNSNRDRR